MNKKSFRILTVIFLLSLAFNLYLGFSSPYLNNADSYFNIRIIDNIKNTGLPITYDELSYGGRPVITEPLFHYLFALLSFIPYYFKIFPALLISSLVIIVYFISKEIINDETSSLLTSLLSGFVPIYSNVLINQFTPYSLVLPLMAFIILCFMKLENKKYLIWFLASSFLLAFIHTSSFLLLFILLFYILLMNSEDMQITKLKRETLVFTFFLILFINLLVFRKVFLQYGFDTIYGNNPVKHTFDVLKNIYIIGIIPLFLGITGLYQGFFRLKKEPIILISSMILSIFLLLLLNLLDISTGLLFLSFGLVVASSLTIRNFFVYLEKTKFNHLRKFAISLFIFFIIMLLIIPAYFNYNKEFNNLDDFHWFKANSGYSDVILTPLSYGHIVTYFSDRKNVIDGNFFLAPDPDKRYYDVNLIYSGWSYNKALELLHEYDVKYIYIGEDVKKLYNIQDLKYIQDGTCIRKIKESIYEVIC